MKSDCAVCYVTDRGFLFPTIASFLSLRKFWPVDRGDIFVFLVGFNTEDAADLRKRFASIGVQFKLIDDKIINQFDHHGWNRTHVPTTTLGRFLVGNLVPDGYLRLLYLDGDTIIVKDPTALIEYDPGPGYLAAAEDINFFCRNDLTNYGSSVRSYFKGIGISQTQGYFNAGVFVVRSNTWRKIAREALDFFLNNVSACKSHDQSALNAVAGTKRKRLSLAWNFQTPFRYLDVESKISPAVYHFTQSAKPWMGRLDPWLDFYDQFSKVSEEISDFKIESFHYSRIEIEQINGASRSLRRRLKTLLRLRLMLRQTAIARYESDCVRI